jgi:RNA polymerase sigma factor for flagellar operon FliA
VALPAEWAVFFQTRSPAARNSVYALYAHLPRIIARKMGVRRDNNFVSVEECEQYGAIGLLRGIDMFKPDKGSKPESYLKVRIRGTILDNLRVIDVVKKGDRADLNRLRKAAAELEAAGYRYDDGDLAEMTGLDVATIRLLRRAERQGNATAISAFEKGDEGEAFDEPDKRTRVTAEAFRNVFRSLPRLVAEDFLLYHVEGLSLRDIVALRRGERAQKKLNIVAPCSEFSLQQALVVLFQKPKWRSSLYASRSLKRRLSVARDILRQWREDDESGPRRN